MTNIPTRCFPENYIVANPQLGAATYNSNLGSSNYHSLQVQFTMRPVQGISFQTTYGWAKTLGSSLRGIPIRWTGTPTTPRPTSA